MPRTKQDFEQQYLKTREERMNRLRSTSLKASNYEKDFRDIIINISRICFDSVMSEYNLKDNFSTEGNRIRNWVIAGKSLEEISQLPEAQIPGIKEHLQELFDAGSVERQYRDETIKMIGDEIPNIQLIQVPDNEIEQKLQNYGIPMTKSQRSESDKAAERKLLENELHYQLADEFSPSGAGGRVISYLALDGKKTYQEQFEIYEKAHTNQGRYEIAKAAIETALNIDVNKYLTMGASEYAENYLHNQAQALVLFDGEFLKMYHDELSEFLNTEELTDYEKYSTNIYTVLNARKLKSDSNINNVSQYIDPETVTLEQLTPAISDQNNTFKEFATTLMSSKVVKITPKHIQLGIDIQKKLRNLVVLHNPEIIHEVPSLKDNTWDLRKPQDPKAQRPWDKDLGHNVMPVDEVPFKMEFPSLNNTDPNAKQKPENSKLSPEQEEQLKAKQSRANQTKENRDNFFKDKSNAYRVFLNMSTPITRGVTATVSDIQRKGLSVEAYSDDYAYRIYSDGPKLSYEEFCQKLKVPDNEKLTPEEIQHRKALSAFAVKKEFSREAEKGKSLDFKRASGYHGFTDRTFISVMMDPGKENLENNKNIYNTIQNGTAEEKKKLIEGRLTELINRSKKYIGKALSDEEVIENSEEIQQLGLACGMEWPNFKAALKTLKDEGVEISENILNDMQNINESMYVINNIYTSKIDYIASMYYQYGGFSQFAKYQIVPNSDDGLDTELMKSATAVMVNYQNTLTECVDVANKKLKSDNKNIVGVYSLDGKLIGQNLTDFAIENPEGGEMAVFYKDDPKPHLLKVSNLDTLNPELSFGELTKTQFKRVNAAHFDFRFDLIDKQGYSKERQKFEESILEDQYKLAMMIEDDPKGKISDIPGVKDLAASYFAKITIKKSIESIERNKADNDIIKDMISSESIKSTAASMKKGELLDKLLESMPQNLDGIMMQDQDDVYKLITSVAQKKASKEFKETQKANRLDKQKNTISKTYADVEQITSPEFWGIDKKTFRKLGKLAHESLQSLSLDRNSAQTIAFAKLIQDGKSIDDILDPTKLQTEKAAASKAVIALIKNGDAKQIANLLYDGREKLINYIDDKTKNISDFSVANIMSAANKNLLSAVRVMKDFSQEFGTANSATKDPISGPMDLYQNQMASNIEHVFKSIQANKTMCSNNLGWTNNIEEAMVNAVKCSFMTNYVNQQRKIPGKENLPVSQLIDIKAIVGQTNAVLMYQQNPKYLEFYNKLVSSEDMKQKFTECIKDGSFDEIFKPQMTVEGELPSMTIDFEKAFTALSVKPMLNNIKDKKSNELKLKEQPPVLQSDEQRLKKKDLVLGGPM